MSKLHVFIFVFLFGIVFEKVNSNTFDSAGKNYCDPGLCKWQPGGHIGCNNNGEWSERCSEDKELVPIDDKIDLILHLHNKYRSFQALGEQVGFLPASRMPTLKWNSELAYLCELNVKTCDNNHDFCHNTKDFMFSGQNLGALSNNVRYIDEDEFINNMIGGWFTEYQDANQTTIDRCCSRGPSKYEFKTNS